MLPGILREASILFWLEFFCCYSDEIVAMKDGQILAQGAPEDILTAGLVREIYGVDLNVTSVDGKPFLIPV